MSKGMSRSEAGRLGALASRETRQKQKLTRITEYNKNPKRCKFCNEIIPYEKSVLELVFCDHSCSASYNNVRKKTIPKPKCLNCGKEVKDHINKFCNHSCQWQHVWKENKKKIIEGKYTSPQSGNELIERFLIEERGRSCEKCGRDEWEGEKIPLNIHHVDGDATNNLPVNLQLLCLNCHGITDNYGSKNKNCTRNYRYKKLTPM
jgi:hypothetical protein